SRAVLGQVREKHVAIRLRDTVSTHRFHSGPSFHTAERRDARMKLAHVELTLYPQLRISCVYRAGPLVFVWSDHLVGMGAAASHHGVLRQGRTPHGRWPHCHRFKGLRLVSRLGRTGPL